MMTKQSTNQVKADAINEFMCSIIGALESGFIDDNKPTIAQLHRVAQNFASDRYGVQLPHITVQWGVETAKLCGYEKPKEGNGDLVNLCKLKTLR